MEKTSKRGVKLLALATGTLTGVGVLGFAPTAASAATTIATSGSASFFDVVTNAVTGINVYPLRYDTSVTGADVHVTAVSGSVTVDGTTVSATGTNTADFAAGGNPVNVTAASDGTEGVATVVIYKDKLGDGFTSDDDQSAPVTVRALDASEVTASASAPASVNLGDSIPVGVTLNVPSGAPALAPSVLTALDAAGAAQVDATSPSATRSTRDASLDGTTFKADVPATAAGNWYTRGDFHLVTTGTAVDIASPYVTTNAIDYQVSSLDIKADDSDNVHYTDVPGSTADSVAVRPGTNAVTYSVAVTSTRSDLSGIPVSVTVTPGAGTSGKLTVNGTAVGTSAKTITATTDSSGVAMVTVSDSAALANDAYTVAVASGSGPADSVDVTYTAATIALSPVTPANQTLPLNGTATVSAKLTDSYGKPLNAGYVVQFATGGPNSVTQSVTPDSSGVATFSYSNTKATAAATETVTVKAYDTSTLTQVGSTQTANVYWSTTASPAAATLAAANATRAPGEEDVLTGYVYDQNGLPLAYVPVTVTATNGEVSDTTGTGYAPTATVYTGSGGSYTAYGYSTGVGKVTFQATAGSISKSVDVTYANATTDARNISVTAAKSSVNPGEFDAVTAKVVDVYGNPVSGVAVTLTENGTGRFASGASSVHGTTGTDGTVSADLTSATTESGDNTVTATVDAVAGDSTPYHTGDAVNVPFTGAPAGNASSTVKVTFMSAVTVKLTGSGVPNAVRLTAQLQNVVAGTTIQVINDETGTPITLYGQNKWTLAEGATSAVFTVQPVSGGYAPTLKVVVTPPSGAPVTSNVVHVAAEYATPTVSLSGVGITGAVRLTANLGNIPAGAKIQVLSGNRVLSLYGQTSWSLAAGAKSAVFTVKPVSKGYAPALHVVVTVNGKTYSSNTVQVAAK